MTGFRRFHLFAKVLPIVAAVVGLKLLARWMGFEFLSMDGLVPSLVAGAVFLIGFLLSHVLSDYKEAERTVSEIRVALETIEGDAHAFLRARPDFDLAPLRAVLVKIVAEFEACLGVGHAKDDLAPALACVDALSERFAELEAAQMSERYIVRLRMAQDGLRRAFFRVAYIQRMQFVPSVHWMVRAQVACCLFVMLFIRTAGPAEGAMIVGSVSFMFIYAIFLIRHLEKPFRKGEHTPDDVSLFLLRDFAAKLVAHEGEPVEGLRETLKIAAL
jgi:hypothetical protein